jgi:hypothetical protein
MLIDDHHDSINLIIQTVVAPVVLGLLGIIAKMWAGLRKKDRIILRLQNKAAREPLSDDTLQSFEETDPG